MIDNRWFVYNSAGQLCHVVTTFNILATEIFKQLKQEQEIYRIYLFSELKYFA